MILITGANGFIGSAMVWEMNSRGFQDLICVDSVSLLERNVLKRRAFKEFILKDDLWSYLETPESQDISWVIHMGACSSTTETRWDFLFENNTEYTQKIFKWCAENKKGFIYASSAATYGSGEFGYDDAMDSEKLKPLNLYGESKVLFDRWAVRQANQPPFWYGLKFFNVFGPNEYHKGSMTSVAFKAYHQILKNACLGLFKSDKQEYRDGHQMRDFIYIKDVTRWMYELMETKPSSGLYNMGFGHARTWLDLASAVFNSMGKKMSIQWLEIPENIKNQYQYFTEAKMSRWKNAGLSEPQWPLDKAISDYIENYLDVNSQDL